MALHFPIFIYLFVHLALNPCGLNINVWTHFGLPLLPWIGHSSLQTQRGSNHQIHQVQITAIPSNTICNAPRRLWAKSTIGSCWIEGKWHTNRPARFGLGQPFVTMFSFSWKVLLEKGFVFFPWPLWIEKNTQNLNNVGLSLCCLSFILNFWYLKRKGNIFQLKAEIWLNWKQFNQEARCVKEERTLLGTI